MANMIEIPRQYFERRLDELNNAEQEIERLRAEISALCPIGDFDVITSLRAEKAHMTEIIEELTELTREVINLIIPNESEYKCDYRRDWASGRLREILGIVDDD